MLSEDEDGQSKLLQDYRLTLTEGYQEYLTTFEEWSQSLGVAYSPEPGYNLPIDKVSQIPSKKRYFRSGRGNEILGIAQAASVPLVSRPELESLAFPTVEHALQFMGAAHLTGRNLVTSEIGAFISGAYSVPVRTLVHTFQEAFAAGVNVMQPHGMPYSGEYFSTWPGFSTAGFVSSEVWNPRVPDWEYLNDAVAYANRNQYILQTGVPKRDVVLFLYNEPW